MVDVSLMPPVDYCASCEGKRAEDRARDIAITREAKAFEASRQTNNNELSPGALPSIAAVQNEIQQVDPVARPLLSPSLAVQASLAGGESNAASNGSDATARLLASQAYGQAA